MPFFVEAPVKLLDGITLFLNVNEEHEVYDVHLDRSDAEYVQAGFPNDSIVIVQFNAKENA